MTIPVTVSSDPLSALNNSIQKPLFIPANRPPTTNDIKPAGTRWQDLSSVSKTIYETTGAGVWVTVSGTVTSISGTTNQITATPSGQTYTLSIPSTFIAPGSIASTTTITSGTGITATLGNITATNGNMVLSAAGTGMQFNPVTASGAASGTVTCNGRVGQVTFTSPSVAGGADLTLTMANSAITGSSTILMYAMKGATTGAGLCVKSGTASAGQYVWVLTNATGATTSTADISINFSVLN